MTCRGPLLLLAAAAAAAAAALGGCSAFRKPNPDPLAAKAVPNYPENPRRLLVYSDASVGDAAAGEFEAALKQAIAPCGVRVAAYRPFSVNDDRADEYRRLGKPDHTLSLPVFQAVSQGGEYRTASLALSNSREAEVWSAQVPYEVPPPAGASALSRFAHRYQKGELASAGYVVFPLPEVARRVVRSLQVHRVLKACRS